MVKQTDSAQMAHQSHASTLEQPEILARGPWALERVRTCWLPEKFEPSSAHTEAADAAIRGLQDRGSPSHDGMAARLVDYHQDGDGIAIELQPLRWALRLVAGDASLSMAALCVTRSSDGRWLAGRRAQWVSSWAGRWALGAGGAVDVGENPGDTLVRLPQHLVMFVGQAWLAQGAEDAISPDHEHDAYAWWPREIARWPAEAEEPLRRMASWLEG